jgi:hypothetical protein
MQRKMQGTFAQSAGLKLPLIFSRHDISGNAFVNDTARLYFCEHGAFPDLRVVFRKTAAIMPSLDPTPCPSNLDQTVMRVCQASAEQGRSIKLQCSW